MPDEGKEIAERLVSKFHSTNCKHWELGQGSFGCWCQTCQREQITAALRAARQEQREIDARIAEELTPKPYTTDAVIERARIAAAIRRGNG